VSVVLTGEALLARREEARHSGDLPALAASLAGEVQGVLAHPLYVPEAKALLSRWGAHCKDDGAELAFDPWAPHAHRCSLCGRAWDTEQSHRWWVYWYQLWLAERVWLLALHAGPGGEPAAESRALEALAALAQRYLSYPAADNVLGPSRPFFSTYLESVWVLHVAAATSLLGSLGRLPADLERDLREKLLRPSSALIADFDEGFSNRQVWNAAALFALGRVLGDEAMQKGAAHGKSGLLAVLDHGLLDDGLWYEGENYHWFALRGLAWGAELLRQGGEVDLWADAGAVGRKFRAAFRAPVLTALPDFTFPARRDSKFGVSLRQRRMAELWELALARDQGSEVGSREHASLLRQVYDASVAVVADRAREITEVERNEPASGVRREQLGWKALLWMSPDLEQAPADAWRPGTTHLEATGLAIFRRDEGRTYVGLDYGESGGAHGHPDRLNVTLVQGGMPWLLDFGTGSYVAPTLNWYRATLAHNAPLLDGQSQVPAHGTCVAFEDAPPWGWACALLPEGSAFEAATIQRTVVMAPGYVLDVVQMASQLSHELALPWHGLGKVTVDEHGVTFTGQEGRLRILLTARQPFSVLVQRAPGPPAANGATPDLDFPVAVAPGEAITLAACLDLGAGVEELECTDEYFIVRLPGGGAHMHHAVDEGWRVELDHGDPVALGGLREEAEGQAARDEGLGERPRTEIPGDRFVIGGLVPQMGGPAAPAAGTCAQVAEPPALDGTLEGFPATSPLALDRAEQFRRAEAPWPGAESFSARAYLAHDDATLYVAVDVTAPEPAFRPSDAANPEWENENPDIHSDGLQLYVETTGFYGWLIVPVAEDPSRLRVTGVRGSDGDPEMITAGAWEATERGYRITLAVDVPDLLDGKEFGFDLYVNRAQEGRERRTGQLVWSGARDTRLYLAGDRPLPGPLPRITIA
jgi:hypothetical protein